MATRPFISEADYDLVTTLQSVLGNNESRNILARLQATPGHLKSHPSRGPPPPPELFPGPPVSSLDRDVERLAKLIEEKDDHRRAAERRAAEAEEKLRRNREDQETLVREHAAAKQEAMSLREINKGLQLKDSETQAKLGKTQSSLAQALARVRETETRSANMEAEAQQMSQRNQSLQQLLTQSEAVHAEELTKREREVAREIRTDRDSLRTKFQEADAEKRAAIAAMATVLSETEDLATKATDMDLVARLVTTSMLESLDDAERLVAEPTGVALLLEKLGAVRQQLTQVAHMRQDLDFFRKRFRVIHNRLSTPASTSLDVNGAEQQLRQAQNDLRTISNLFFKQSFCVLF